MIPQINPRGLLLGCAAAGAIMLTVWVVRILRPVHVAKAEQHIVQAKAHEELGQQAQKAAERVSGEMKVRSKALVPLAVKAATLVPTDDGLQEISPREIRELGELALAQDLDLQKLQAYQKTTTDAYLASIEEHNRAEVDLKLEVQRQAAVPRLTPGKVLVIGGVTVVVTAVVVWRLKK